MPEKTYRVRVAVTHKLHEETLRALWAYHRREDEPFSIRKAIELARGLLSENPEMETQIQEGNTLLEQYASRAAMAVRDITGEDD